MITPEVYITTWAAILVGMAVGFLICQLVQPISKWFGPVMCIALLGMAFWLRSYGAVVLLVKP